MIIGILTIIGIYLVIVIAVLGLGIGVGYLVNWIVPAIGVGTAVVIGVIANVVAFIGVGRFLTFKMSINAVAAEDDDDEDNDGNNDDDDSRIPLPRPIVYVMEPPKSSPPQRKRRK